MKERDFSGEFEEIMRGQVPTMAERMKQALDDPLVQYNFDLIGQRYDVNYLYFMNVLGQRYGMDFDDCEEVYHRLAYRRQTANG